MIAEEFLHIGLALLILSAAGSHAIMDSIKDLRTHFGDAGVGGYYGHPYRDFWHAMQLVRTAALLGIGHIWGPCVGWDPGATYLTAACSIVAGRFLWEAIYRRPWTWLIIDMELRLRTGWPWLDKLLGLHW